ncbi:MAG TPA: FAD-dependent monooxygenase [Terriglobia bacterium]|nr:FAD-dependent monooxygenase [Terriglobia bacterium]
MTIQRRVLISGASIAGPAAAYWLHKYGFAVTVVEHAPGLRPGGFGVDIRGAAIEVARRMGILDEVRAHDTRMQGTLFVDAQGKTQARMGNAAMGNQRGVDVEIMRDDLSRIIYSLTEDKVRYVWGDSIKSLNETSNGVDVTFDHGQPQTFDLVIGADGMHSKVRALLFGDEAQFTKSLGCYISIFSLDNHLDIDHQQRFYTIPGKTVGMYSARNNAEAKGIFVFKSAPLVYDFQDEVAQKKLVTAAFADEDGWETQHLLQAMDQASDFYFDAISQIHMPVWSKGRAVLVGDAAYGPSPLSGQGSTLALVGAYVLAGELKVANSDYSSAFTRYEEKMRKYAEKNQKIGVMAAGGVVESSALKIGMRNFCMRVPGFMTLMFKGINRMVAKSANGIELNEY